MKRFDRVSPWLLCAATLLSACGGGGGDLVPSSVSPPPSSPPSTTPPTITTQPASQTVAADGSATFTVAADNGPLVYQWLVANSLVGAYTEIRGASSASYTVTHAGAADNGHYYRVLVANGFGTVASDPVQLVVTGLGGAGPGPTSTSCGPWLLPVGTEVRTSYTTTTPAFSGESVLSVNAPVTFDGHPRTEVRVVQPLSSTVTLDVKVYGDADSATGNVTGYGAISVSTADLGGVVNKSTVQSVATAPTVDIEFALAPGATAPARRVTFVDTTVVSLNGVDQPPTTTTRTDTAPATTYVGDETVSVPAGTFTTCKYTTAGSTTTRWLLKGYGSGVKDSAGGQATQIKVNGSVITGN